jgi:SAM-dependent methyltransferase
VRQKWLVNQHHVVRDDVADLAGVDGGYEVVSFSHVLEHVADPAAFLGQVRAALRPDGVVLCEVPNVEERGTGAHEPHVLFFNAEALRRTLEQSGFVVTHLSTAGHRRGSRLARRDHLLRGGRRLRLPASVAELHPTLRRYDPSSERIYLRCVARTS